MLNHVVDIALPPASLAVAALALLALGRRWARQAAAAALLILVALSIPLVANALLSSLGAGPATPGPPPRAIVILSADGIRIDDIADQGAADLEPGPLTLDRIRAGAALARSTGLPILVSGGSAGEAHTPLGAMMADSLRDDFRIPARWEENRSVDTWQNAAFSAEILRGEAIERVYLVTHAWHLPRAMIAFRRAGLDPVPAPVRPPHLWPVTWHELLPRSSSWYNSYIALHEWVGLLYYRYRQ